MRVLRLACLVLVASVLLLAPASAGRVEPESCPYGAISAMGPVDAQGRGNATPAVACLP